MASKQALHRIPDHTAITRGKKRQNKTKNKVKSKGHLADRSSGVPPFSAWVEPVFSSESCAMNDALCQDVNIKKIVHEKAERLKDFQSQVQSRVKVLERVKRQEQLGKSIEAVEIVRNIVHQSSFPRVVPSRSALSKHDTCSFRHGKDQPIMRPITKGIIAHSHQAVDAASQLLDQHAETIRQSNKYARSALKARADGQEGTVPNDLPGGRWNPCIKNVESLATRCEKQNDNTNEMKNGLQNENEMEKGLQNEMEKGNEGDFWLGQNEIKDISEQLESSECEGLENIPPWLANADPNKVTIFDPNMINRQTNNKKVTFTGQNLDNVKKRCEEKTSIKSSNRYLHKKAIEDLLKPGKVAEDTRQQQRSQMALYRKLFMDIEREQVRENIRMKEHRKRMAEIKVEKEIQRLEAERKHKQIKELEYQHEEDLKKEQQQREAEENQAFHRILEQRQAKLQKNKESERFIEAMKSVLKEKVKSKGIRLQPLCSCGPSFWDTSPDTCANNCIYYRNIKEYARALSSIIGSLD